MRRKQKRLRAWVGWVKAWLDRHREYAYRLAPPAEIFARAPVRIAPTKGPP